MKPQQYERWIFESEDLSPEQRAQLEDQLDRDPDQRRLAAAWEAVESELMAAPMAAPPAGFAARWRQRLAARKLRTAQRVDWLTLGLLLGAALLTLILLGAGALGPITTPAELGKAWTSDLVGLRRSADAVFGVAGAMLGSLPPLFQVSLGLTLLLTAGWISVVWLASIYRYAYQEIPNGGLK